MVTSLHGQEILKNIDSSLTLLRKAAPDTSKAILFQKIGGHYNVTALDSAKAFFKEGIQLSKKINFPKGEWMNLNGLGNFHERKTQYDSAMYYYNNALKIVETLQSTIGFAIVLNNIATIHIRKAEFDTALNFLFEALKAEEKLKNQNGIAQSYNNIGVVYYYTENFEKTTFYLEKALSIQEELGNQDGLQNGYNNVGAIYDYQKKFDEAIASYTKALHIARAQGDIKQEASFLTNIALSYSQKKDFTQAKIFFNKSLALRESIKDYNGMAHSFVSFGQMYFRQEKYKEASELLVKGVALSKEHKALVTLREGLSAQSEIAAALGNHKLANSLLYEFIAVKDSILNANNTKAITEIETKYQTEKKEKEILAQRAKIAENELKIKRKNILFYGSLGLAILLGLLGYLFYSKQKLKNNQLKKESELKQALAKIEIQNTLQEQRLRISRDLHDNIGAQLTFIISSLDNLKFGFPEMQEKLSQKLSGISTFASQTIYELRDTIWAMNKVDILFEDLQSRISNFINQAQSAALGVQFNFTIASSVDQNKIFTSVQGMNMYRIIQEAVNNALKYANASIIDVHIAKEANTYFITITDNGKGFNPQTIEMGNGLLNMEKRARDLRGAIEINSQEGKGTKIELQFSENNI